MGGIDAERETGGAAAMEMAVEAVLERGGKIMPCRNCAAPVLENYCGRCGQAVDTHRRSLFHILYDLITDIASFDSRILRTVRALFLKPGELSTAFREGRTQRYVPPIRLYLFVSLIFFLFLSTTNIAIVQLELAAATGPQAAAGKDTNASPGGNGGLDVKPHFFSPVLTARPPLSTDMKRVIDRDRASLAKAADPDKSRRLIQMMEALASEPAAINRPLTDWIPRVLFILLPAFALVLALFYWRQRKEVFFVDHLVFSLGIHSFVFATILIAIILAQFLDRGLVLLATLGVNWLYLILAMKRFYRQGWGWTLGKFFLVSTVYGIVFLLPAVGGIFAVSLLNL
jgi:hypothetical protein